MNNLPKHVRLARQMLGNILKGHGVTAYRHTDGPVTWGSDMDQYISLTDCSGYINALLKKSYGLPNYWLGTTRPYASTYYRAINSGKNFARISNIKNVRIGDFIVFRIIPGTSNSDNTGHIMIVNGLPKLMTTSPPIKSGTLQWSVYIIDQSSQVHGDSDTRYPGKTGLGSGYFRIYTDASGRLQGHAWSTEPKSKFYNQSFRPLVIGRLRI